MIDYSINNDILKREESYRIYFSERLREIDASTNKYAQCFINSISFPKTISSLEEYVYEHGRYNMEDVLMGDGRGWTVPRSAKVGDVVLWFHAKTAISRITALITAVRNLPEDTAHDRDMLLEWLERARKIHKQYGGKIFGIGRVTSRPSIMDFEDYEDFHFKGRIYADIGDIVILDTPIDISDFNSFITVSRHSGITHLASNEFERLREIISARNTELPDYYTDCLIGDFNLSRINKNNYIKITKEYRRRFMRESDFRSYYVDYLLRDIAGRNVYRECNCYAKNTNVHYADNVFRYDGKYYLLEVKLDINIEADLKGQIKHYINSEYMFLDKEHTKMIDNYERKFMYVIDTRAFYRYDADNDALIELVELDNITSADEFARFLPAKR